MSPVVKHQQVLQINISQISQKLEVSLDRYQKPNDFDIIVPYRFKITSPHSTLFLLLTVSQCTFET